jgi:hypothetical protein
VKSIRKNSEERCKQSFYKTTNVFTVIDPDLMILSQKSLPAIHDKLWCRVEPVGGFVVGASVGGLTGPSVGAAFGAPGY